jgi:hypothetical protein
MLESSPSVRIIPKSLQSLSNLFDSGNFFKSNKNPQYCRNSFVC